MTRVGLAEKRSLVSAQLAEAERASKELLGTMLAIPNISPDLLIEIEKVKFSAEEFSSLQKGLLYDIDTTLSAEELENLQARVHRMAVFIESKRQELSSENGKVIQQAGPVYAPQGVAPTDP